MDFLWFADRLEFCRQLIENKLIPEDVTVQVLVQAREHLIPRTFEALRGIHRRHRHVYNSTSTIQRKIVFRLGKDGVKAIAVNGANDSQTHCDQFPETDWIFQYSPRALPVPKWTMRLRFVRLS